MFFFVGFCVTLILEMAKSQEKTSKTNSTWTVRGVSPETRTAVKIAARKSGKTQGEWLEKTLAKASREDASHSNVPAPRLEDTLSELVKTLQDQNERLAAVESRRGFLAFFRR
jgi:hypothetical protein